MQGETSLEVILAVKRFLCNLLLKAGRAEQSVPLPINNEGSHSPLPVTAIRAFVKLFSSE